MKKRKTDIMVRRKIIMIIMTCFLILLPLIFEVIVKFVIKIMVTSETTKIVVIAWTIIIMIARIAIIGRIVTIIHQTSILIIVFVNVTKLRVVRAMLIMISIFLERMQLALALILL